MELALELAGRGAGFSSPNPMVGAVCVKNEKIIGKGFHECFGGPHAEVNALNDAGKDAEGSTLYVTLEPCNHQGKTPPCTKKILESRVKKVVVAMDDPNPQVQGGGNDFLRSQGVEVVTGVLEEKSKALNLPFIKHITRKKPYTILKLAMTLDGKIATRTGHSKWITNEKSRNWAHRLRHQSDAVLVGRNTVSADNPSLTARLGSENSSNPLRVVLDSYLKLDPDSGLNIFSDKEKERTLIVCCADADPEKIKKVENTGPRVIKIEKDQNNRVDFEKMLIKLGKLKISSLMIEGGAVVAGSVLNKGLVDQIAFFYGPKILACSRAFDAVSGEGPEKMDDAVKAVKTKTSLFDNDILVESRIESGWNYNKELIWPVLY